ncbi:MAG: addiction module protein [Pirellulales bacterium]
MNTASNVPIESFSVEEKLLLMERLWGDLSRRPADIPIPQWHTQVLAERLAAVEEGRDEFVDWDDAQRRLRAKFE